MASEKRGRASRYFGQCLFRPICIFQQKLHTNMHQRSLFQIKFNARFLSIRWLFFLNIIREFGNICSRFSVNLVYPRSRYTFSLVSTLRISSRAWASECARSIRSRGCFEYPFFASYPDCHLDLVAQSNGKLINNLICSWFLYISFFFFGFLIEFHHFVEGLAPMRWIWMRGTEFSQNSFQHFVTCFLRLQPNCTPSNLCT